MIDSEKLLTLILHIERDPWKSIADEGQRKTWIADLGKEDRRRTLFYVGNPDIEKDFISGDTLYVKHRETYETMGEKAIKAFSFALENFQFDFLFRTNTSSYVDTGNLRNFLETKKPMNYYGGVQMQHGGIPFASGCGYVVSRDLVEKIVEMRHLWPNLLMEDVETGKFLHDNFGILPEKHPRYDAETQETLDRFTRHSAGNHFHVRCRSWTDRTFDIRCMKQIHSIYQQKGVTENE